MNVDNVRLEPKRPTKKPSAHSSNPSRALKLISLLKAPHTTSDLPSQKPTYVFTPPLFASTPYMSSTSNATSATSEAATQHYTSG